MRPRRASTLQPNAFGQSSYDGLNPPRRTYTNAFSPTSEGPSSYRPKRTSRNPSMEDLDEVSERTPMLSASRPRSSGFTVPKSLSSNKLDRFARKNSDSSDTRRPTIFERESTSFTPHQSTYNVNYPPSVPQSPELSPSHGPISFRDVLGGNDLSPERQDDIDDDSDVHIGETALNSNSFHGSLHVPGFERRPTIAARAEEDVCFPADGLSEIGDDDTELQRNGRSSRRGNRRRRGKWPDLAVLDAWSALEKEGRDDQRRVKRMVEPQLIGGRLRPTNHRNWHRVEEDAPYRFTYFNEEFPSTIHSQTISELVQPGGSFKELFIPDPPELSDSSSDEEEETRLSVPDAAHLRHSNVGANGESRVPTRQSSALERASSGLATAGPTSAPGSQHTGNTTPAETKSTTSGMDGAAPSIPVPDKRRESGRQSTGTGANWEPPKRYGERPTWWLDVLSPTEPEMKVLSKAFGIHPLTAEDIMMQEAREKVELFRNYYFVNYRSFEQDMNNEDFLEPVNMYIVVFREGVVSFHFSLTPHPANVRRRIRQLKDYLILSSDWISYAMIDDITDVFAPLIQNIEDEVDDIDDAILMLHSPSEDSKDAMDEKKSDAGGNTLESGGDMLRRVGDCRKKVMGLYRLLGNKADVIKGFAKRCNEHWEVAPRSEIGLYLGDIQDHIVTMTGNLSHYEK